MERAEEGRHLKEEILGMGGRDMQVWRDRERRQVWRDEAGLEGWEVGEGGGMEGRQVWGKSGGMDGRQVWRDGKT